jgi:hypothetical protein
MKNSSVSKKSKKLLNNSVINVIINLIVFVVTTMIRHIVVVLNTPDKAGERVIDSNHIYTSMLNNPWFPNPLVSMADFRAIIDKYVTAIDNVRKRIEGAEGALEEAWNELNAARLILKNYVQIICIQKPLQAIEIAESAGMSVKKQKGKSKQSFSVKGLAGAGADLSGKVRHPRCGHEWQCTTDITDPLGWYVKPIESTLNAKTQVWGFKPGDLVYFRHRCILPEGCSEWDEVISIIIPK